MCHVVSVTFSDANFSYIPIVMTMEFCLSYIYVECHKILKGSYSEIENLQDFASGIGTVTDTTKNYLFVPDRNVLWCEALD